MARVLVVCSTYPADLSSGDGLRFQNFCKQIAERHECYLVCFNDIPEGIDPESHIGIRDFATLPPIPRTGGSVLRHLRLTNTNFLRRSAPAYLSDMRSNVGRLVEQWNIEVLFCLAPKPAETVLRVNLPKVLDFCDSRTLTLRRMIENRGSEMSFGERLDIYVRHFRERYHERALVRRFDRTMAISIADRDCLAEISGKRQEDIEIIPNGVSSSALEMEVPVGTRKRSAVFWGNLDFPPNWTALHYFNKEIFLPHLADRDVEWHIIGKGADESILHIAQHPGVHLHGFVDDLYAEISSHGVMVNPMVEGSGLKNKVLEAFACHLPVVSTTMGIEAIGARIGEHYIAADDPAAFAAATIRCLDDTEFAATMSAAARRFVEGHFDWNVIGKQLDDVITELAR